MAGVVTGAWRIASVLDIAGWFPNLPAETWRPDSKPTADYNCIAWAAGDTARRWWPDPDGIDYWPIPEREATAPNFLRAFATLGYTETASEKFVVGWDRLALYIKDNEPTHMARQISLDTWTSKLGNEDDILHATLRGLAGKVYGAPRFFLHRRTRR